MSNSLLFHCLNIHGFDHCRWHFSQSGVVQDIVCRKGHFSCSRCKSPNVTATPVGERRIQGSPLGKQKWFLNVKMHRLRCHDCGDYNMERLPFTSSSHSRITLEMERSIIEMRHEMSINAVAEFFGVPWRRVKEVEKKALEKKYKTIRLKDVRLIGIDEIYTGRHKFKTIVRDLVSGAVLFVGDGKGKDALEGFTKKLSSSRAQIEAIAMDMSNSYHSWAEEVLPDADVVFDHFHLIKLMNTKVDEQRRETMNQLNEDEKKTLKKNAISS